MTRRGLLGLLCSAFGVFGLSGWKAKRVIQTQVLKPGLKLFAANETLMFEIDPRLEVTHGDYDAEVCYGEMSMRPYQRRPWDSGEGYGIRSEDCIECVQEIVITLHKRPDPRYDAKRTARGE